MQLEAPMSAGRARRRFGETVLALAALAESLSTLAAVHGGEATLLVEAVSLRLGLSRPHISG